MKSSQFATNSSANWEMCTRPLTWAFRAKTQWSALKERAVQICTERWAYAPDSRRYAILCPESAGKPQRNHNTSSFPINIPHTLIRTAFCGMFLPATKRLSVVFNTPSIYFRLDKSLFLSLPVYMTLDVPVSPVIVIPLDALYRENYCSILRHSDTGIDHKHHPHTASSGKN